MAEKETFLISLKGKVSVAIKKRPKVSGYRSLLTWTGAGSHTTNHCDLVAN